MLQIIDQFTQSVFNTFKKADKETLEKRDKIKKEANLQKALLDSFMVMDISTEEGRQAAVQIMKSVKESIHRTDELMD